MSEHRIDQSGYERLGARKIGLPEVLAQSVGFMGPVFSSAFVIPLVVGVISASGKGGGVASPISVIIAAVGVFAIGWVVSSYARRVHAAGSLYDYVSQGLGEQAGVVAGLVYYLGVVVLSGGAALLAGGYIESTVLATFGVDPLPAWAWSALVLVLIAVVLYTGVRISTRVQLVLAAVSMAVVLAFFIEVIVKLGSANSGTAFNPSSAADGWSGIFFGVLYGVLVFVGFESAANLAEETRHPRREVPMAVMGTVAIATLFFILATYVEVAGFHFSLKAITAAATAPLFALGAPASHGGYGGTWIDRALELVVLFDMLAVIIGGSVSGTRGTFAMARDRRIPAPLAKVSKRFETPLGATVFVVAFMAVMIVIDENWQGLFALPKTPHYFSLFSWCSTFGGFALVVVYLAMSAGSFRTFATARGRFWVFVAALLAIGISAGAMFGSFYKVTDPTLVAPEAALVWLGVAVVIALVTKGRARASTQLADLSSRPGDDRTADLAAVREPTPTS